MVRTRGRLDHGHVGGLSSSKTERWSKKTRCKIGSKKPKEVEIKEPGAASKHGEWRSEEWEDGYAQRGRVMEEVFVHG